MDFLKLLQYLYFIDKQRYYSQNRLKCKEKLIDISQTGNIMEKCDIVSFVEKNFLPFKHELFQYNLI